MPDKAKEPTRARLHNMLVHEVSLVDRAANKRRFLVVKRSEGMGAEAELLDDGRGGLVDPTTSAAGAGAASTPETTSKAKPPFPPPGFKPGGGGKEDDEEDEEEDEEKKKSKAKKESTKKVDDVVKQLEQTIETIKAAGGETDPALKAQIDQVTKMIAELRKSEPAPAVNDDAADLLKSVGADDTTIASIDKLLARRGSSVQKAGAKMAKERLDQFRKAMDILQTLLKDFLPAEEPTKKSLSGVNPMALLGMDDAAFVASVRKNANANPDIVNRIVELTKAINKNNSMLASQQQQLEDLKKSGGHSNAIPFERRSSHQEEVPWPLDMNRPDTRESVTKDDSFYDAD